MVEQNYAGRGIPDPGHIITGTGGKIYSLGESLAFGPHGVVYQLAAQGEEHGAPSLVAKYIPANAWLGGGDPYDYEDSVQELATQEVGAGFIEVVRGDQDLWLLMPHTSEFLSPHMPPDQAAWRENPPAGEWVKGLLLELCDLTARFAACLDKAGSCHGNLKPSNIQLRGGEPFRLSDPYWAGLKLHGPFDAKGELVDPWFRPPEVVASEGAVEPSPAADVWALGIIAYQLLSGRHPLGNDPREIAENLAQGRPPQPLAYLPAALWQFLEKCLCPDRFQRIPNPEEMRRHLLDIPFHKECQGGHQRDYHETVCGLCQSPFDLTLDIPVLETGADIPCQGGDTTVYHSGLPVHLRRGESHKFQVRLIPGAERDIASLAENGLKLEMEFRESGGAMVEGGTFLLDLLPRPKFQVPPKQPPVVELDGDEKLFDLDFSLDLINSNVLVTQVECTIDGNDRAVKRVDFKPAHKIIRAGDSLEVSVQLDRAELGRGSTPSSSYQQSLEEYNLALSLHLAGRADPIVLDERYLGQPLKLTLHQRPSLARVEGVKDKPNIPLNEQLAPHRSIPLKNQGGGSLVYTHTTATIAHVEPPEVLEFLLEQAALRQGVSTERADPLEGVVVFDRPSKGIKVRRGEAKDTIFTIHGAHLPKNLEFLVLDLQIHYHYDDEGGQIHKTALGRVELYFESLRGGYFLACDFGTTNSLMVTGRLGEVDTAVQLEGESFPVIPSAIRYFGRNRPINIGKVAEMAFRRGDRNAGRSFKRLLASKDAACKPLDPDKNKPVKKLGGEMTADYLRECIQAARASLAVNFSHYVFTYPSKWSQTSLDIFRCWVEKAGVPDKRCRFIDEATAGALYFIVNQKELDQEDHYRLAVFDFGGGTIDIAYLEVEGDRTRSLKAETLDVDGVPDYGGDNVTQVVLDLVFRHLREDLGFNLLWPRDKGEAAAGSWEERAQMNYQRLFTYAELQKEQNLFGEAAAWDVPWEPLWVLEDGAQAPREVKVGTPLKIDQAEVLKAILQPLDKAVSLLANMVAKAQAPQGGADLPVYVVLAGRSSAIPLLSELLENYREGKRPDWDEDQRRVVYRQDPDRPLALPYKAKLTSDRPKECVALGALSWLRDQRGGGGQIQLWQMQKVTTSCVGLVCPGAGGGEYFVEPWIRENLKLVPKGSDGSPDESLDPEEYAVHERTMRLYVNESGEVESYLLIFHQFMGQAPVFDKDKHPPVGEFTVTLDDDEKPEDWDSIEARVRAEMVDQGGLRVWVHTGHRWIEARDINREGLCI